MSTTFVFAIGDEVCKRSGDYTFDGVIVASFRKLKTRSIRYIVEDSRGLLLILNSEQITLKSEIVSQKID